MKTQSLIETCRETRDIASSSLIETLPDLLTNRETTSEKLFASAWLTELHKKHNIFPEGWYTPPPHGIGVLFGRANRDGRQNYKTLRPEAMWPKENVFLKDENDIAYLFASPVNKETGIIGDFGITVYIGDRKEIKEHLQNCLRINKEIFEHIEVGMKFSELYTFAERLINKYGMRNEVTSTTDPTGRDYGHTIPGSFLNGTTEEQGALKNASSNWDIFKNTVSKKRVFVNRVEETTYQPGMAVTLEPRLTASDNQHLPMGTFHTIVVIQNDGTKELVTNFDDIFSLTGMNYMA